MPVTVLWQVLMLRLALIMVSSMNLIMWFLIFMKSYCEFMKIKINIDWKNTRKVRDLFKYIWQINIHNWINLLEMSYHVICILLWQVKDTKEVHTETIIIHSLRSDNTFFVNVLISTTFNKSSLPWQILSPNYSSV